MSTIQNFSSINVNLTTQLQTDTTSSINTFKYTHRCLHARINLQVNLPTIRNVSSIDVFTYTRKKARQLAYATTNWHDFNHWYLHVHLSTWFRPSMPSCTFTSLQVNLPTIRNVLSINVLLHTLECMSTCLRNYKPIWFQALIPSRTRWYDSNYRCFHTCLQAEMLHESMSSPAQWLQIDTTSTIDTFTHTSMRFQVSILTCTPANSQANSSTSRNISSINVPTYNRQNVRQLADETSRIDNFKHKLRYDSKHRCFHERSDCLQAEMLESIGLQSHTLTSTSSCLHHYKLIWLQTSIPSYTCRHSKQHTYKLSYLMTHLFTFLHILTHDGMSRLSYWQLWWMKW